MYVYASERSEKLSAFLHSKTAISFNILLVLQILCLINIFIFRCQMTSAYIIHSMQFPFSIYGMVLYIQTTVYRQNPIPLRKFTRVYANERSERASLENFGIITFLNCHFFQFFVGTSHTLSVQMTCLSAHMYRQISKCTDKSPKRRYWGGGGGQLPPCPPPPPLAMLVICNASTLIHC